MIVKARIFTSEFSPISIPLNIPPTTNNNNKSVLFLCAKSHVNRYHAHPKKNNIKMNGFLYKTINMLYNSIERKTFNSI